MTQISETIEKLKQASEHLFGNFLGSSILLVGSVAREEELTEISDVDLIIYYDAGVLPSRVFYGIGKLKMVAEDIFQTPVSLQIITPDDLEMIVASTLLPGYIRDGIVIFGRDLREKFRNRLALYSPMEKKESSFKRILFERYHLRAKVSDLFTKDIHVQKDELIIGKRIFFIMKELKSGFDITAEAAGEKLNIRRAPSALIDGYYSGGREQLYDILSWIDAVVGALKCQLENEGLSKLNVW